MIVNDLDVTSRAIVPIKTNTPLIIDANAPLTLAISFERLQPVMRRDSQRIKALRGMQHLQFPHCHLGDVRKPGNALTLEQAPGIARLEGLDHTCNTISLR